MKAIVFTKYGPPDVLQLEEVEKPVPGDNEVLIKIHATTVTAGDCEMRRFDLPAWIWLPLRLYMGIRRPRIKILGQELAGEIESVGKNVTQFRKGDPVFCPTKMSLGAYAEYICMPGNYAIVKKPDNLSYEEAATIPTGGLNALHFLMKGNIKNGEKVLIYGAGGSIGTYAVQIAKSLGADVTSVDSTGKLDMLHSIGADHVIDYTKEDFTQNSNHYDVIFDVVGKSSFLGSIRSLRHNGRYLLANPNPSLLIRGLWVSTKNNLPGWATFHIRSEGGQSGKKVITGLASYRTEHLNYLKELIEAGQLKPVIDRCYPLKQVAEAHTYVENGHKKANVVITVEHNNSTSFR
ncbi:MAG: NADPH:quinone oxidoreductase [Desulfobacterales bacterium SG8_35_2]|nr:MAG: NADPH:quinone oxidoreductase [Desulfobacterales bacterium SG8_35_2]